MSYDPGELITDWCKLEKVPVKADGQHVYDLAAVVINRHKNFSSAVSMSFGLKWSTHRDYLQRAKEHLMEVWEKDQVATAEWLQQFVTYYVTEKEIYPADG